MPIGSADDDSPPSGVPRLRVVRERDSAAATLPDLSAFEPRVWTDQDGRVCAYGYSADGRHVMQIPGVGSFHFGEHHGDGVTVVLLGGSGSELVEDVYLRMVVPMVLQVRGREVLHASAVLGPSGVAAFCAVSRTGKSTLAFALSQRGYPLWADDVVALNVDDAITVLPLPFRIRLMPEPAALLMGREHAEKQAFGEFRAAEAPSPLAAILLLERAEGDAEVKRISPPTVAFPLLLSHAYSFTVESEARKRETIENYLRVAARVPLFGVRVPAGLSDLDATLGRLETSLADVAAGSP